MNNFQLLRIKLNNKPFLKFSKTHGGRDFLLSYPAVNFRGITIDSHCTLHTPNDRVTFKTTSIKEHGTENLLMYANSVKDNQSFKDKVIYNKATNSVSEIDLYKGKAFHISQDRVTYVFSIALHLKNDSVDEFFLKSRTTDEKFLEVKNIVVPQDKDGKVTIKYGIGKGTGFKLESYFGNVDDYIFIEEKNHMNVPYTFFFGIYYSFPEL